MRNLVWNLAPKELKVYRFPPTLSALNFRRHLSSTLFLTKYRLEKSLNVKLKTESQKAEIQMRRLIMSRLIWIYAICKSLLLSPVAVK